MNAQHLDWSDYQFVLAVGRTGTLSGAARTLGVNHSTVFRRLNTIEEKLGVRLFERLHNGYAMTPAGEEMMASAVRIEEEVITLERQLTGQDSRLSGTLRVTTTDTLWLKLLAPYFADFVNVYPGIQLEVNIAGAFLNLTQRETDIAIRATPNPPETLIGRHLCDVASAVYGAITYLDTHQGKDLSTHIWLTVDASLAHLASAQWLSRTYPQARIALRCNTLAGLLEAAKTGLGLVALPCFVGDTEPGLHRVTEPNDEFSVGLWLLTHTDLRRTARVRAFMDFITQKIVDNQRLLEGQLPAR